MKAMSNEDFSKKMSFARKVMDLSQTTEPFQPTAVYDPDGDCIEFVFKPDNFYARRIDDLLTVYYSQENEEIVGSLIKGVSEFKEKILKKCPGFIIEVHEGRIHLAHLFRAQLWSQLNPDDKVKVLVYQKLIICAEKANAETELSMA